MEDHNNPDVGLLVEAKRSHDTDLKSFLVRAERTRRNLLIVAVVAIVVGQTNLVPAKIETLGISFDAVQQANFRYVVGGVLVYFLLLFTQHVLATLEAAIKSHEMSIVIASTGRFKNDVRRAMTKWKSIGVVDALLDVVLPYVVGVAGLAALFHWLPKSFLAS
jgi:hypothetical protein